MPRTLNDLFVSGTTISSAELTAFYNLPNYDIYNYNTTASNIIQKTSGIEQNSRNEFVFYTGNVWILKISDKRILFNTNQFTMDEITKHFLQTLSSLTHIDGLQYTFDF